MVRDLHPMNDNENEDDVDRRNPWRATLDGVVIACRLTPKGGRDAIDGVARLSDGTTVLLARVRTAPEDGRANEALCALHGGEARPADVAGPGRSPGAKSRLKQVAVGGDPEALIERLRAL